MNKSFALLFTLIIMPAVAITPCCMSISAPNATYLGTYSAQPITASPSITFSSSNSAFSYTVGMVPAHAGFEQNFGNSSGNIGFLYNSGSLTLGLTVNTDGNPYYSEPCLGGTQIFPLGSVGAVLTSVSYKASWLDQPVVIYAENISDPNALSTLSYNLSLANIPEGHQQIIVTASEEGYIWNYTDYWSYSDSVSAVFNFNVVPLSISFISPVEGQVFHSSEVPLAIPLVFNVNEAPTWLAYSLDGEYTTPLNGNTTLIGFSDGIVLTKGHYSLTIYAEDSFGNIGKSETVNFTIAEPQPVRAFPTATVAAVSVIVVAIVGIGLAVLYHRTHRKAANLNKAIN